MKKILGIFGIASIILMATVTLPVLGETKETVTLDRIHIIAIGTFAKCEENQIVHGRVLIGLIGFELAINKDIEFSLENIKWILMSDHILHVLIEG